MYKTHTDNVYIAHPRIDEHNHIYIHHEGTWKQRHKCIVNFAKFLWDGREVNTPGFCKCSPLSLGKHN